MAEEPKREEGQGQEAGHSREGAPSLKTFTVIAHITVTKEWYGIRAADASLAIAMIADNPSPPEPDAEYPLKGGDYDAEEEGSLE